MSTKKATAQQTEQAHEAEVLETFIRAQALAEELFGAQANDLAVHEIYDYLVVAEEAMFVTDLKRAIEHTKRVRKTETPSPEQVFGLFDRLFSDDDEE